MNEESDAARDPSPDETARPKTEELEKLSATERKQLELGDNAEHEHGEKREQLTKKAQELGK